MDAQEMTPSFKMESHFPYQLSHVILLQQVGHHFPDALDECGRTAFPLLGRRAGAASTHERNMCMGKRTL